MMFLIKNCNESDISIDELLGKWNPLKELVVSPFQAVGHSVTVTRPERPKGVKDEVKQARRGRYLEVRPRRGP